MIICKYVFDSNIYNDYLPEFNAGFTYTKNDIVEDNLVTRTINSDVLPTLMRFGKMWNEQNPNSSNRELCLLTIDEMNTSELTTCHSMFRMCKNLRSINCNWNTSKVTITYSMFSDCSSLTSLDLSSFDTSKVTSMSEMFRNCPSLTSLDLSSFNTSKVTDMSYMFQYCSLLTSLDVSNWNTGKVTRMGSIFSDCSKLTSLDLSSFNTSKVTDMSNMFNNCSKLTSLDLSSFNTSKVTRMSNMFHNCSSLNSLDVSSFDTSKVTEMRAMFHSCRSLTSLDLSSFDTSKVTSMNDMFYNCSKLTSLDVSSFDTSKVTNMGSMFGYCSSLNSLDVSNFDTSKVTSLSNMFKNCSKLTSLDLSNWNIDLSVLTNYTYVIANNNALETINLSYANEDTISVILGLVPSQAITVKVTPDKMAYTTDTAPSNVTVIDVISTIKINTTKQQLIYNILFGIKDSSIIPKTKEEIILYGIMMGQAVTILPSSIKQELLLHISKGTQNANIIPRDKEELILYGIMIGADINVKLDTITQILYYNVLKNGGASSALVVKNLQPATTWTINGGTAWTNTTFPDIVQAGKTYFIKFYNKPSYVYRVYFGDNLRELDGPDYAIVTASGTGHNLHIYSNTNSFVQSEIDSMTVLICEYVEDMENKNFIII